MTVIEQQTMNSIINMSRDIGNLTELAERQAAALEKIAENGTNAQATYILVEANDEECNITKYNSYHEANVAFESRYNELIEQLEEEYVDKIYQVEDGRTIASTKGTWHLYIKRL